MVGTDRSSRTLVKQPDVHEARALAMEAKDDLNAPDTGTSEPDKD